MLKFYHEDQLRPYGDDSICKDRDIVSLVYDLKKYAQILFNDKQMRSKNVAEIQAWVANNINYDVLCVKHEVDVEPEPEELEKEVQRIASKGLFKKKDPTSFDVQYDAKRNLTRKTVVWGLYFCDPSDAVQFKLIFG